MANYQASGSALGAGTILLPYVAPGTSGNVLTSNGLAWTSADRTPNTNILIDGGFTINQRVYVSNATLSAGAYAHDRWKAGSGGGDYTFTQLKSPTIITIKANKTLIQVVEDVMVDGGTYTLSWEGTCQGRVTINSATPSGAYANSPITVTGQTPGTAMSVEFGKGAASGTLGKVKLEIGSVATPFVSRPYEAELALCRRYCKAFTPSVSYGVIGVGFARSTTVATVIIPLSPAMRDTPTLTATAADWVAINISAAAVALTAIDTNNFINCKENAGITCTVASGLTANTSYFLGNNNGANGTLILSAEL
jgi:hypothetical protein